MDVSAATWNTLSKLLDEALDLEPAARAAWCERLSITQPSLAPSIRKLLQAHASSETADVMASLPKFEPSDATRSTALAAGDLVGPYRLKRELGGGGMADVWLAERADGAFSREVALKLPLINRLRRDLAQRFARERDILARLEYPNIARLYDAGVSADGLPYLAMEYVDGRPITEYCDSRKLNVEARLRLLAQVLDAVQYAHASLIIHRDLKPSNILVTTSGDVRLLDFGIAKLLADDDTARETQLTQLSGRALTPDYASPEQIKGEPLTIATDIYSLGVVLYELLAGARPYRLRVKSAVHLEQAIIDAEPQRPSSALTEEVAHTRGVTVARLAKMLRGDLDTITLKALAKLPAQRYLTVSAFAEDLERHRQGRPVLAQRASWTYRAGKFVARNRIAAGSAAAIVAVMLAATIVSLWQAQRAELAAAQARGQAQRAEAVRDFLAQLFQASSLSQRSAEEVRNMNAIQLLERGVDRIDILQKSAPEAHAYLLRLFGQIYDDLSLYQASFDLHQKSVAAARTIYGHDAYDTAVAELGLAWALKELRRPDEGLAVLEHSLAVLRSTAPRSADLAQALYYEAEFFKEKDPERAIRSSEAALELIDALGLRNFHAANARWTYARALRNAGQRERAMSEYRKTGVEFEQLLGTDYVFIGSINVELADLLRNSLRFDEARVALLRAVEVFSKRPELLQRLSDARRALASLLFATGDAPAAKEQLDRAVLDRLQAPLQGTPAIEQVRGSRARLAIAQGDVRQGIKELLELQQTMSPALHTTHLLFCDTLARAYLMIDDVDSARKQIQLGKAIVEQHGASSWRAFSLAAAASLVAAYENNSADADTELEAAGKSLGSVSSDSAYALELLLLEARVANMLGRLEESRKLTAGIVDRLLTAPANSIDVPLRGELAHVAAESRIESEPDVAQQLSAVAVDLLRKTQVPASPLLKHAETTRLLLLKRGQRLATTASKR